MEADFFYKHHLKMILISMVFWILKIISIIIVIIAAQQHTKFPTDSMFAIAVLFIIIFLVSLFLHLALKSFIVVTYREIKKSTKLEYQEWTKQMKLPSIISKIGFILPVLFQVSNIIAIVQYKKLKDLQK
ncbi:Uncharacterised protein [Mesomycoplasma conjunctivae]|nr:hypothetical protein [Mesomycoplasma conjunctivae]VEU65737.1 Uncharacterised protein [Mesomycoplasma conjunctivae]